MLTAKSYSGDEERDISQCMIQISSVLERKDQG
jgi:hypothetical protein